MRDRPKVMLSLEGVLRLRLVTPHWQHPASYEETWRTPSGRFISGTIARAMRADYVREVARTYRLLERDPAYRPLWYKKGF